MTDYGNWGEKPLPVIDPDSERFWAAAADGELVVQRCEECGERQFYPRRLCRHCWSDELEMEAIGKKGTIYSYSRTHVPGQPGYGDETPYVVALVELDIPEPNPSGRAVRLVTHIVDTPEGDPEIGLPVEVSFKRVSEDPLVYLPVFSPQ